MSSKSYLLKHNYSFRLQTQTWNEGKINLKIINISILKKLNKFTLNEKKIVWAKPVVFS